MVAPHAVAAGATWSRGCSHVSERVSFAARVRHVLAGLFASEWPPSGNEQTAYFTYAKSKTALVDGRLSHPAVDAVVGASAREPYRYYQFGSHDGPALLVSDSLPYRVGIGDFVAALLTLDGQFATHYRFVRQIHSGVDRRLIPWRSHLLWNVRTLLIAYAFAWRMREIARVHRVAFVTDFYSASMLGATLAFRRLGREVWDIQHGRIGPAHQAYNTAVFSSNCGLRPTGLVVWSRAVGSYVDRALGVRWVSTEFAHLRLTGTAMPSRPRSVLFTLQVDTPLPHEVAALIRDDPSVHWTFRPHPGGRNPESELRPLLELPNVALSGAGTPLQDDILGCAVHVTVNSSVAIEAAALGVRSIVMDEQAAGDFADEIASRFVVIGSGVHLGRILPEMLAPRTEL